MNFSRYNAYDEECPETIISEMGIDQLQILEKGIEYQDCYDMIEIEIE